MTHSLGFFKAVFFTVFFMMFLAACGQKGALYLPNIPPAPNVIAEQSGPPEVTNDLQDQQVKTGLEGDQAADAEAGKDKKTPETGKSMSETTAE